MPIVALLLLLVCPRLPLLEAPAVFVFELSDGSSVTGEWLGFSGEGAELSTATGRAQVAPGDLLLVTGEAAPGDWAPSVPQDIMLLVGQEGAPGLGDRLVGRLVGGDDLEVRFWVDGAGEVVVPFENIDRLLPATDRPLDRLAQLAAEGFDDRVWRRRDDSALDAVDGVVAEVSPEGLVLESALGDLALAWSEVLAVVLADTEHPGRDLPGWPVRLGLQGGSVFSAGLLSVSPESIVVSTQFSESLQLHHGALASMVLSERAAQPPLLLAELSPVAVDEWPSLGRSELTLFPWRRNLSVAGSLLRMAGLPRVSGLGVHGNSTLTFEVPAEATQLRVTVGLSDDVMEIPALGTVSFTVKSAGLVLAAVERLEEGQSPVVLRIEGLVPGQQLAFLVGDAGDYDAGDRAVWADGVFVR
ncbi:MAG: hypothetical protein ACI9EF_002732 [Pseudohongiellaceae bacterium]|jgi:hypothetical protein